MGFPSLDWIGSNLGIFGSLLLATNTRVSPLGWIAYLGSNVAWLAYGVNTNTMSIATQYLWYMGTTGLAIYRFRKELLILCGAGLLRWSALRGGGAGKAR